MLVPSIINMKSLNIIIFLNLYLIFIYFASNCMICQDLSFFAYITLFANINIAFPFQIIRIIMASDCRSCISLSAISYLS